MRKLSWLLIVCLCASALSCASFAEELEIIEVDAAVEEAQEMSEATGLTLDGEGPEADEELFDILCDGDETGLVDDGSGVGEDDGETAVEALPMEDGDEYAIAAGTEEPSAVPEEQSAPAAGEADPAQPAMAAAPHVDPNGPQLSSNEITLGVGESYALNPVLTADAGGPIACASSNAAVAEVSADGVVTAVAPGEAVITATAQGGYSECFVHVKYAPGTVSFSADGSFKIGKGEQTDALKVVLGSDQGECAGAFTLTSSDDKVASIDSDGVLTGVKTGSATIEVRTYNDLTAQCEVTVEKAPDKVTAKAVKGQLGIGETSFIKCELPKGTASQITYSSEDPSIVAVDPATGEITGVAAGKTRIKAETFNGKKAYADVSVGAGPESIAFDVDSIRLGVGMQIKAAAKINDGAQGEITYSVQDESVAACKDGSLKGIAVGETILTATAYNGLTAQCAVTVVAAPEKVQLPFKKLDIGVKQKYQLQPSVGDSVSTFTYATSNKKIVKVSQTGELVGVKKGSATVTIKTYNKKTFKLKVNVINVPSSVSIEPKSTELGVGETVQLKAKLPAKTAAGVTYTSSDDSVAVVDAETGVVTAVAAGTAKITAKTHNGKKAVATIEVTRLPEWIEAETGFIQLASGQSKQLSFKLSPGSRCALRYNSQDPGVASIDKNGVVTGVSAGETVITADTGVPGVVAQVSVTVLQAPDSVSLATTAMTLNAGDTYQVEPIIPEGTFAGFTFESSNADVATVSEEGAVVAVSKGKAVLTVSTHNGKKAQLTLTVLDPWYPDKVTLTNAPESMKVGESLQLDWTVKPADAVADLAFKSSNEAIATVDDAGLLRAVNYGYVTITATSRRNKSIKLEFKLGVGMDDVVLAIPKRTTDIAGIPANLAMIDAIRASAINQIDGLESSGTIKSDDARKRRSIINNAFKDYAFPWMTPSLQKYWRAANSEGGAKNFKPDRVYYGLPYMSGSGNNRTYNAAKALKEKRYTDSGEGYYLLNKKNLLSGRYCGNDCSCFVSAAIWGTNSGHSDDRTKDIASSSAYKTIKSFNSMRPGDLICKGYAHVVMFLYYTDPSKERIMIIQNGGDEAGINTVNCVIKNVRFYSKKGYKVRRLKSLG